MYTPINNMGHMRISGTEPSSVIILSQKREWFQRLESDVPKVPETSWSQKR